MKLGSLFDGSGGFPLAGAMHGIEPVWASEIEPFPIRVTKLRFPNMKHLGSVTDVHGDQVEPVDIITFGSPCQDLSVAGKQAGIHEGARSNLFFEAVRIIKEMRNGTSDQYPRFAVWENVPGAFSSNKGADFRAVLEALCGIKEPDVSIPQPETGWKPAGLIVGDGYSIAWRVYDAQYWGVPQRRKRIYLIADFGSECAGEILFKPESLPGNPEPGSEERKSITSNAERSAGGSDSSEFFKDLILFEDQGGNSMGQVQKTWALRAQMKHHEPIVCYSIGSMNSEGMMSSNPNAGVKETTIARTIDANGSNPAGYQGGNIIVCYDARGNGEGGVCPTLTGDHENRVTDYTAIAVSIGNGQLNQISMAPVARSLDCMHDQQAIIIKDKPPRKYIVRRLTPLECGRLQGFPDWWCDGADGSDSAIYKMWGNGIALPCAADVLGRLAKELRREKDERG